GDAIARAVVRSVEHVLGAAGGGVEEIDRREADALELEGCVLAGLEGGAVELLELEAQVVDAGLTLPLVATERGELLRAATELDLDVGEDREVGDAEMAQHGPTSLSSGSAPSSVRHDRSARPSGAFRASRRRSSCPRRT